MKKIIFAFLNILFILILVGCRIHKHIYNYTIINPTCTAEGYTEYICECGDTYKDSYTEKIEHVYGNFVVDVAPTTSSEGTKSKYCQYCLDRAYITTIPKIELKKYTVTFITNCDTSLETISIIEGEKLSVPTQLVKEGYLFEGWYYNDENWNFETNIVTSDITLEAKWSLDIEIIWNNPEVNNVKINETIQLDMKLYPLFLEQTFLYETSDSTVASVDENGVVTGLSSGDVVISVYSKEYTEYVYNINIIVWDNYIVETINNLNTQPDDSVVVTFRVPFGTKVVNLIRIFADEFETMYPSVKIEIDEMLGYDEMKNTTISDLKNGNAPTMIVGYPEHFLEYLKYDGIIFLDDFINSCKVGYTDNELNDFVSGFVNVNKQYNLEGNYFGLPFNRSTEVLYYNADFFKNFNLKVPQTWTEFEELSEKIFEIVSTLKDDQYPWLGYIETNLKNKKFIPCLYDSNYNLFLTITNQFGGEYWESIYQENGFVDFEKGTIKFDKSSKTIEALSYLQELSKKGYFNICQSKELSYGSYDFNIGRCVMNIASSNSSAYYSDAICSTAVAPIPYKDADHKYVSQQGTNVCIMSQASDLQKLAAWLFIKHMLTPENTAEFAIATGYMPVRQSSYDLQDYLDFLEGPTPAAKVHQATAKYASEGYEYFVETQWIGISNVKKECQTAVAEIFVKKFDVEQALKNAINRLE